MFRLHFTIATMVSIADPRALCNPMAISYRWILDKRRSIWSHAEILITKFQTLPDCCRELFLVAAALNRPPRAHRSRRILLQRAIFVCKMRLKFIVLTYKH